MIKKLRKLGVPVTRPEIIPKEERVCCIREFYNINLAMHWKGEKEIVKNDISFSNENDIFILTGPNSGGKTTYINAVALIQVLSQSGIYVPAEEAVISPVDYLYTHFPCEEKRGNDYGRLGEEAKRLNEIFKEATRYSLIILNESLASTSPVECLFLSKDVMYGLKLLNARAIFATHQHELAANLEEINNVYDGNGKIGSLIAVVDKEGLKRTYRVLQAPPEGLSYARDIAESFGITYEQIVKIISNRFLA
jgi:DNA mismatch repair ATPase MutS